MAIKWKIRVIRMITASPKNSQCKRRCQRFLYTTGGGTDGATSGTGSGGTSGVIPGVSSDVFSGVISGIISNILSGIPENFRLFSRRFQSFLAFGQNIFHRGNVFFCQLPVCGFSGIFNLSRSSGPGDGGGYFRTPEIPGDG